MILVDTSIWIDHFRTANAPLAAQLEARRVLTHPFVIGEIALGSIRNRAQVRRHLSNLPSAAIAADSEVLAFIDARRLNNTGVGCVDAALLASVALSAEARIWSKDRNVMAQASRLGLAWAP
jgi:predicted nucleic acid-binding protein